MRTKSKAIAIINRNYAVIRQPPPLPRMRFLEATGPSLATTQPGPAAVDVLDKPHEIADSIDFVDHNVIDLDTCYLILDRNHQIKTIETICPEVVAEARLIPHTIGIDSEIPGYIADIGGKYVIHGRCS
jgi:hypothetical protein